MSDSTVSLPWRVIDFCRHFDIDTSAVTEAAGTAAAPIVFPQLAQRHNIPLDAAAARLRQQNIVETLLDEEGCTGTEDIALDVLTDKPISSDRAELCECVARFLSNRRRTTASVKGVEASKQHLETSPSLNRNHEMCKKLISMETALFSMAVHLSRKEEELKQRQNSLELQIEALTRTEESLKQNAITRRNEIRDAESVLEEKRKTVLVESAKLEERKSFLESMEENLKVRSREIHAAEESLAAARVELKAREAKLAAEQRDIKENRDQCASVANRLFAREKRLKMAEEKLAMAKRDLIQYEASLCSRREK